MGDGESEEISLSLRPRWKFVQLKRDGTLLACSVYVHMHMYICAHVFRIHGRREVFLEVVRVRPSLPSRVSVVFYRVWVRACMLPSTSIHPTIHPSPRPSHAHASDHVQPFRSFYALASRLKEGASIHPSTSTLTASPSVRPSIQRSS